MKKIHVYKAGEGDRASLLFWKRSTDALEVPFRTPHHTTSVKGCLHEVAVAAGGVLVLDDAQEFKPETMHEIICLWHSMGVMRPAIVLLFTEEPSPAYVQRVSMSLNARDYEAQAKIEALVSTPNEGNAS